MLPRCFRVGLDKNTGFHVPQQLIATQTHLTTAKKKPAGASRQAQSRKAAKPGRYQSMTTALLITTGTRGTFSKGP
jgi:hypothetical protein